jgi:hypothetical protein
VSKPTADGTCAGDAAPEFDPVADIHIGVISSSLGGHGGAQCQVTSTTQRLDDKAALLVGGGPGQPDVQTFKGQGFLAWDQGKVFGGETDRGKLDENFQNIVKGVGQDGCGFEASLEAWYRFLVDPNPPVVGPAEGYNLAPVSGPDQKVLRQRADFLRPDSLVAVVALSDENDCSIVDGFIPPQVRGEDGRTARWPAPYDRDVYTPKTDPAKNPGGGFGLIAPPQTLMSAKPGDIQPGTKACRDPQKGPFSDECFSCLYVPQADAAQREALGCNERVETDVNLRCFDQRRRFGFDGLYPVQRYVDAIRAKKVYDTSGAAIALSSPAGQANAIYFANDDPSVRNPENMVAPLVPNPLYDDLPWREYEKTCTGEGAARACDESKRPAGRNGPVSRPDGRVYFAGIVGVPWQDIAVDPASLENGGYKDALSVDWALVLGDPEKNVDPTDPLMVESVGKRFSNETQKRHPVTGAVLSDEWNPINGHDWNVVINDDLQYACVFPLRVDPATGDDDELKNCAYDPEKNVFSPEGCDCPAIGPGLEQIDTPPKRQNPLCQKYAATDLETKAGLRGTPEEVYVNTQARAKAYPGPRFLRVLKGIQDSAIVASICPQTQDATKGYFGYRPAVNAIIDRLKNALKGRCLPRRLDVQNDRSPCLVLETKFLKGAGANAAEVSSCQACNAPGYRTPDPALLATLQASATAEINGEEVADYECVCEFQQLEGAALATCQTDAKDPRFLTGINGWCYVDPSLTPEGDPKRAAQQQIVADCAANEKRTIRFLGQQNVPADSAERTSFFITCLGGASTEGPTAQASPAN